MKKVIFSFVFVLLACQCFAQAPLTLKEELWQKSRHQRTVALVLYGVGAPVGVVSFVMIMNGLITLKNYSQGAVRLLTGGLIAGLTLMAGSIPFYIMAGKNKRLSLAATSFYQPSPGTFGQWSYEQNQGWN